MSPERLAAIAARMPADGVVLDQLADFRRAEERGGFVARIQVKYVRRAAVLKILCTSCGSAGAPLLIGAVVREGDRLLLLTRHREGGFTPSLYLDTPFWGDSTFCRRRQEWALRLSDLAEAIESNTPEIRVDHSMT